MQNEKELVKQGFAVTGITKAVKARKDPVPARDDSDAEDKEWEV